MELINIVEDSSIMNEFYACEHKNSLNLKIYFEKSTNLNPYYIKNEGLKNCAKLIQRLSLMKFDISNSKYAEFHVNKLYETRSNSTVDCDYETKKLEITKILYAEYLIASNIFILNFRGGNRNTISNECEIDIEVMVYKDTSVDEIISEIEKISIEYGAKIEIKESNNMLAERYNIPKEKIIQIETLLNEKDIDSLLILSREYSDSNLPFIVGDDAIHLGAAFLNKNKKHIMITSQSDKGKFEESGIFSEVITYNASIKEKLSSEFNKMNIKKLALNISEEDNLCDGLTQGLYMILEETIGKEKLQEIEVSSDEILKEIRSQKSDTEIDYLKESIRITQEIYDEVFCQVKCGMSEIEIGDLFIEGMKKRDVVNGIGESYAYPIICLVRAGLAHRNPGHTKSQEGDILIMDFSVRYKGYVSDIARTAYFLKKGETEPPKDIQHAFDTAYKAITETINYIGVGKRGYEVDAVGRKVVEEGGFPTVRHSVGHQIGRECHDTGTRLAQKRAQSEGFIKTREVYAIEPTVIQDDGLPCMLVEENVVIRETGAEILSRRQEKLYLIDSL